MTSVGVTSFEKFQLQSIYNFAQFLTLDQPSLTDDVYYIVC